MKNLFAFGFLALALTAVSCGNGAKTTDTTDSLATDTTIITTDSIVVTDSTLVDSTATDSIVNAQ